MINFETPALANAVAVAAPIPRDAPVTNAVFPLSSLKRCSLPCIILLMVHMKYLTLFVLGSTLCGAASIPPKTEIGEMNGAKFRIDIPENWNGGLVIYCHGYSAEPVAYKDTKLPPLFTAFTDQGYALAQSGYAAGGWA